MKRALLLLAAMLPGAAAAHRAEPGAALTSVDPLGASLLALLALLYLRGARIAAPPGRRCFCAGWTALTAALVSPLDALGEELFSAHMVQHEVLMLIAAPLLVLSRPAGTLLWGLPASWRRPAASALRPALTLARPGVAWTLHAAALWAWHAPPLMTAALASDAVHVVQHLTFFLTALLFWWSLAGAAGHARRYGAAVLYVFTTAVHSSLLGALLTFAPAVWYEPYLATAPQWGLTPLHDQQLGGLIMWVPGCTVLVAAGLVLFARWLQEAEWRSFDPTRGA